MIEQSILGELLFKFPFRKYQKMILDNVEETKNKEHKFHIVSPPGSGKTIVGLELIKRFGSPAVIFTPTSTIQLQWKEKVKMFIPEESNLHVDDFVSTDPNNLKLINIFTYQLLSSPSENLQFIEEMATADWIEQMIKENIVTDETEGKKRIKILSRNNKKTYNREIAKHYKKIKTKLIKDQGFDSMQFLHQNAKDLINNLVSTGVKVIIMDEAHHLLDYWAMIIKELIKKIDGEVLIGLTATPPISASSKEIENYLSIIGDIDFEIPTPAVVKEGNLAPYQDLVYFCTPTKKERKFIKNIQENFENLINKTISDQSFPDWIIKRIIKRPLVDQKKQDFTSFFNSYPFLTIAGIKFLKQKLNMSLPNDIIDMEETDKEMLLEDWIYLLTDYCLNYLKTSNKLKDHKTLKDIKSMLRSFGFVLSENGIREYRSPTDMILALSESKDISLIGILKAEMEYMKDEIRAVVITDFEKQTGIISKGLNGILDKEAGGAVRAFKYIVHNKITTKLEPVLVTGKTMLLDSDELEKIIPEMQKWKEKSGLSFEFSTKKTEYESIVEVSGNGKDWKSNTYVRMVTDLFDKGVIKCIVGTRGLLGEGWDSLSLNTLIDLTSATTSQTVNQIRGRSIRLNPKNPKKLSNNWDIVCIDPYFEKGRSDFNRFIRKHDKFYGIDAKGRVVKGFLHINSNFAFMDENNKIFQKTVFDINNIGSLSRSKERSAAYKKWRIGEKYSNFEYTATKLDPKDFNFKTAFTLKESLKKILSRITMIATSIIIGYISYTLQLFEAVEAYPIFWAILLIILFSIILFYTIKDIKKYIRLAFIEVPVDSFILDIGKCVLKSLRECNLIESSQSVDNIRVTVDEQGFYDLWIDYATDEDSDTFSDAVSDVLAPVVDQRYLVSRSEDDIDLGFYSPAWWFFRKVFRFFKQQKLAYHAVPDVLSYNKARAKNFAENWRKYVGGGKLVYTKSSEGREILIKLRAYNRHKIKRFKYKLWK